MQHNDTFSHWRDSALTPKFFIIDARAAFAVVIFLLHPSFLSLSICFGVIVILSVLHYLKLPIPVAMRLLRSFITGPRKNIGYRR